MTQAELAKEAKISISTLRRAEKGWATNETLAKIAAALNRLPGSKKHKVTDFKVN
jgi:transcriptional regulator with XRE-family HTH domain